MSGVEEVGVIRTVEGVLRVRFWVDVAPGTVANFKRLAREGFYDGTAFHRVVKGFMIQGGDPLSVGDSPDVGTGGPGYEIKAEFNDRPHVRGVISMARSEDPDSAGSQFFICLGDARFLDGQYTGFGALVEGDDVLERLGSVATVSNGSGENSRPRERVGVERIEIVEAVV